MPIEKEYKFVMEPNLNEDHFDNLTFFKQYYLPSGGRVRYEEKNNIIEKIKFNYKEFISPSIGQIEIETDLTSEDAELLVSVSTSLLIKIRGYYIDNLNNKWEIDFLKDKSGKTYFVLMELEIDADTIIDYSVLPSFIKDNILFEVNEDDNSFTSKKLENVDYALSRLKEIKGS